MKIKVSQKHCTIKNANIFKNVWGHGDDHILRLKKEGFRVYKRIDVSGHFDIDYAYLFFHEDFFNKFSKDLETFEIEICDNARAISILDSCITVYITVADESEGLAYNLKY